jgi:hypothetical protein
MSQHDLVIADQLAPAFRADLNDALQALGSLSAGSSEPTTTYANMLWYDSGNSILKMRTEADDDWINIGTLNQATNTFEVASLTKLTQTQAEDGTDTTYGLVSGERIGQAVENNLNVTGPAPMYACRAWANFDGTTSPPTLRGNGNVTSVIRTGRGRYTVTFDIDMPDSNYSVVVTASKSESQSGGVSPNNMSSAAMNFNASYFDLMLGDNNSDAAHDGKIVSLSVFR